MMNAFIQLHVVMYILVYTHILDKRFI